MAVLVQEIINADYAFVIHTTNPSSGDSSEIYAEVFSNIYVRYKFYLISETLIGLFYCDRLSRDLEKP